MIPKGSAAGCAHQEEQPGTTAVVTLGQSLMGNTGDPKGFFEPGPGVFNFNWIDKKCYVAKETAVDIIPCGTRYIVPFKLVRQAYYVRPSE